jgi:hypothetical protein
MRAMKQGVSSCQGTSHSFQLDMQSATVAQKQSQRTIHLQRRYAAVPPRCWQNKGQRISKQPKLMILSTGMVWVAAMQPSQPSPMQPCCVCRRPLQQWRRRQHDVEFWGPLPAALAPAHGS